MDFVSGNMIFNIYYCLFVESVVDGKGGKSIRLGVGLAKINSKNPNNRLFWDLLNAFFPKKKKKRPQQCQEMLHVTIGDKVLLGSAINRILKTTSLSYGGGTLPVAQWGLR